MQAPLPQEGSDLWRVVSFGPTYIPTTLLIYLFPACEQIPYLVPSTFCPRANLEASVYSITQSCPTLYNPMDCSTPGFPVHHQLPEPAQTHVHWVGDAIQLSHHLSSLSPPAFSLSQHQGLFQWVRSLHQVAKVLELQLQHQSFNEYSGLIFFRMDWLGLLAVQGTLKSLLQHHSSKASIFLVLSFLHSPTLTSIHDHWKNHNLDQMDLCWQSNVSAF